MWERLPRGLKAWSGWWSPLDSRRQPPYRVSRTASPVPQSNTHRTERPSTHTPHDSSLITFALPSFPQHLINDVQDLVTGERLSDVRIEPGFNKSVAVAG